MARIKGDPRYYSELYSGYVYTQTGETEDFLPGPAFSAAGERGKSPALTNLVTGERLFLRRMDFSSKARALGFFRRVLDPPRTDRILWPVDLIALPEEAREACTLFVNHEYSPDGTPLSQRPGRFAAVLPRPLVSNILDGQAALSRLGPLSWRNRKIQALAVQLTEILSRLNQEGYLYNDFHLSRLYLVEDRRLCLDYSNLACSCTDLIDGADSFLAVPEGHSYPPEFGDPSVVRGTVPAVDARSQNFSLCALLFYLFFGRCAWDGGLFSGYPDDTPRNHYIKYQDFHRAPIFIFDPEDRSNAIGDFEEEREAVDLWEACPEELRGMFLSTLSRESAERRSGNGGPAPEDWLEAFLRLGWRGSLSL